MPSSLDVQDDSAHRNIAIQLVSKAQPLVKVNRWIRTCGAKVKEVGILADVCESLELRA